MSSKKSFGKVSSTQTNQSQFPTVTPKPLLLVTTPTKVNQSHLAVIHGLGNVGTQAEDGEFRVTTPNSNRNKSFNGNFMPERAPKTPQNGLNCEKSVENVGNFETNRNSSDFSVIEDDKFDLDTAETSTTLHTPNKMLNAARRTLGGNNTTGTPSRISTNNTTTNTPSRLSTITGTTANTPSRMSTTAPLPSSMQKTRLSSTPNKRSTTFALGDHNAVNNNSTTNVPPTRNSTITGFNLDTSNLPSLMGTPTNNGPNSSNSSHCGPNSSNTLTNTPSKRSLGTPVSSGNTPSSTLRRMTAVTPGSSIQGTYTPSSSKIVSYDKAERDQMLDNIQTFIRICPHKPNTTPLSIDIANHGNNTTSLTLHHNHSQGTPVGLNKKQPHVFYYDGVITSQAQQDEVYNTVVGKDIDNIFNNMTYQSILITSYGQTGSGKTFTSLGKLDKESKFSADTSTHGIVPRLLSQIFDAISSKPDPASWRVKMSFLEALDGTVKVKDLLCADKDQNAGIVEINAKLSEETQKVVSSRQDGMNCVEYGVKRRQTANTDQNDQSSRTHALISFHLSYNNNAFSNIHLFDLAGSEKHEGKDKATAAIGSKINSSLTALQSFMRARIQGDVNNGRDSSLTRLFQRYYDNKTILTAPQTKLKFVGCISSNNDSWGNTRSTLVYTEDAKKVKQVEGRDSGEKNAQVKAHANRLFSQKNAIIKLSKELGLYQPLGDEPHNIICRVYDIFTLENIMSDVEYFEGAEKDYIESLKSFVAGNEKNTFELLARLEQVNIEFEQLQCDYNNIVNTKGQLEVKVGELEEKNEQILSEKEYIFTQKEQILIEKCQILSEKEQIAANLVSLQSQMSSKELQMTELQSKLADIDVKYTELVKEHEGQEEVMKETRVKFETLATEHDVLTQDHQQKIAQHNTLLQEHKTTLAEFDQYEIDMNTELDLHELQGQKMSFELEKEQKKSRKQAILLKHLPRVFRTHLAQKQRSMEQQLRINQLQNDKMNKVHIRVVELNSNRKMAKMQAIFNLVSKSMFSSLSHHKSTISGLKQIIVNLRDEKNRIVENGGVLREGNNNTQEGQNGPSSSEMLEKLNCELEKTQNEQKSLQNDLISLQTEHGALAYDYEALNTRYKSLEADLNELEGELNELSDQNSQLVTANDEFSEQNTKLTEKYDLLFSQLTKGREIYNQQIVTLQQSCKMFKSTWGPLDSMLNNLKDKFLILAQLSWTESKINELTTSYPSLEEVFESNEESVLEESGEAVLRSKDEKLPQNLRNFEEVYWETINRYDFTSDVIQFTTTHLGQLAADFADLNEDAEDLNQALGELKVEHEVLVVDHDELQKEHEKAKNQLNMGKSILSKLQEEVSALRENNDGLESECDQLDKMLIETTEKMQGLEVIIAEKDRILKENEDKMTSQRAILDDLEAKIDSQSSYLVSDMTKFNQQLNDLEEKLKIKEETVAIREKRLDFVQKSLIVSQQQAVNYKTELALNRSKLLSTQQELKDLKDSSKGAVSSAEMSALQGEIDGLKNEKEQLKSQNGVLMTEKDELILNKNEISANLSTLEVQMTSSQSQITKLTSTIASLHDEMKQLGEQANGKAVVECELKQCQAQLLLLHQSHDQLKTRHTDLIARKEDLEKEVIELRNVKQLYGVQEQKMALYHEQIIGQEDKIADFGKNVSNLSNELEMSKNTTVSLRNKIVDIDLKHNGVISQYKKQVAALNSEISDLKGVNNSTNKELSTFKTISETNISHLKSDISRLELTSTVLSTDLTTAKDRISSLEKNVAVGDEKNVQLMKEIEILKNQLNESKNAQKSLETTISTQKDSYTALQAQLTDATLTIEQLKDDVSERDIVIGELKTENKEFEAEIESLMVELPKEYRDNHVEILSQLNIKYELRHDRIEEKYSKKLSSAEGQLKVTKALVSEQKKIIGGLVSEKETLIVENSAKNEHIIELNDSISLKTTQIGELSTLVDELRTEMKTNMNESQIALNNVQNEVFSLEKMNSDLKNSQNDLKNELLTTTTLVSALQDQLQDSNNVISLLENDKVKITAEFDAEMKQNVEKFTHFEQEMKEKVQNLENHSEMVQNQSDLAITRLQNVNKDLIKTVVENKGIIAQMEGKCDEIQFKYRQLEAKMVENDENAQKTHEALIIATESKITSLQQSIQSHKTQYEAELLSKDGVIEVLKEQVVEGDNMMISVQNDNKGKNEAILTHLNTIAQLNAQIVQQSASIIQIEAKIAELNGDLDAKKVEMDHIVSENDEKMAQNDQRMVEMVKKCDGIEENYQERISILESRITTLSSHLTARNGEVNSLNEDLATVKTTLAMTNGHFTTAQSTINDITNELTTAQSIINTVNDELTTAQATINTTTEELTTLKATNTTLNEQLTTLQSTNSSLNEQLITAQSAITTVTATNATMTEELNNIKATNITMMEELNKVKTINATMTEELDNIKVTNDTMTKIISSLEDTVVQKDSKIDNLEATVVQKDAVILEKDAKIEQMVATQEERGATQEQSLVSLQSQLELTQGQLDNVKIELATSKSDHESFMDLFKKTRQEEVEEMNKKCQIEIEEANKKCLEEIEISSKQHQSELELLQKQRQEEIVKMELQFKIKTAHLSDENIRLTKQNENFADEINQVNKDYTDVLTEFDGVERRSAQLVQEVDLLKKTLQKYRR